MVVTCEVDFVVGCDLAHTHTNFRSLCPFRMKAV